MKEVCYIIVAFIFQTVRL